MDVYRSLALVSYLEDTASSISNTTNLSTRPYRQED